MSKKLIDEYPLLVLPSLACMVGLNEAIVLQQIHFWLQNAKGGVEVDGYRWVYNTYEEWQRDNFPFWSTRTIIRVFQSLENMKLVVSMQKAAYDRKKYYRIHYDNLSQWNMTNWQDATCQNGKIDNDKMASSLTETLTETTQKEELIEKIKVLAPSIFSTPLGWNNWLRELRGNNVQISAGQEEDEITIIAQGMFDKQFTLADAWEAKYQRSFANLGLNITFESME